jgi:asparagine synthase (glutamine-hydrolysing)
MCGIFGFVGNLPEQLAHRCISMLEHRGPDGSGLWQTSNVTLGHRRLSILDLSNNAKQPMRSESGRYWITFNGEIFNFIELARELQGLGYCFTSSSDTEVALAAFDAWGERCQTRFTGMWALAIWDTQKKELFLSRDRFGEKPLFYAYLPGNGFAIASEMKAIFPLLKQVAANEGLARDMSRIFQYESTEECVIEGIKRLPAGHCAWYVDGKLEINRWWCTLDHIPKIPSIYEDQVEAFQELFMDACALRMRSDVPMGTALSGGLDSSATISCMAYISKQGRTMRMGRDWQHAFVASFPGTPLDEVEYAKMVTNRIGIQPTIVEIDPLRAINELDNYLYQFEDLYITSPIPFMQTYAAVKAAGVSVTLDGHGADEIFGGYSFDFLHALHDAGWNLPQITSIIDTYYDSFGESIEAKQLPNKKIFYAKWCTKFLGKKILGRKQLWDNSVDSEHGLWKSLDSFNKKLYISTHETVLPTLLRNYDRYSMSNGVEIRMPFMDHRVVTFGFALPWTSKIRGGFSKSIIRDAIGKYMPSEIANRKAKIGFNSPIVDWMKGPLKEFMLDTISNRTFRESQLIDAKRVSERIKSVIFDKEVTMEDGVNAWTMLTPYLWEKAVIKRNYLKKEPQKLAEVIK